MLSYLDFKYWIASMIAPVAAMLPDANTATDGWASSITATVALVSNYIRLFDYLINMPVFLAILAFMLLIETALLVVRAWRLVRSFIT